MPVFAYEAVDVETEQSSQRAVTGGVAASASTAADGGDARERTTPDDHARGMNFRGGSFRGNFRGVSGTVVADTPRQARDQLRARGLTVQVIRPVRAGSGSAAGSGRPGWGLLRKWCRLPGGSGASGGGGGGGASGGVRLAPVLRELATLLAVGIPLLDALDTIAKQQGRRWRQVLQLLRDRVASGSSLAEAMGEQPQVFDDLCINIVAVGEDAGTLEMALERLAQFKDRSLQFRNRVTTALLYPLIVLAAGLGVTVFLMTFVVPTLLETLTESGRTLPLSTRIVKAGSDLLIHYWWLILLVLVACLLLTTTLLNTSGGRTAWHRWQLRLPVIGQLARKQAIARVAIVMSTLMRSGITFDRSAEIAARLTRNVILRRALEQCRAAVGAGRDIAGALEDTEAFSPTVVQIFSVGQHSGHLEDMLERLATEYDRDVEMLAQRLTATLEPVLILLLAVVVGTIAFATILPILESGHVL